MSGYKKIFFLFLDIFFPPLCVLCGKYLTESDRPGMVCAPCYERIIIRRYPEKTKDLILRAASDYRDQDVQRLIRALKYKGMKSVAVTLGLILSEHLKNEQINPRETIIVPVPLHPLKERKRGYNQSELIAESVGKALGAPVRADILRRIKYGKSQASTDDHDERFKNIRGAFAPGKNNGEAAGKTIIVIDDVFTSGATMKEAVREIRKMKPRRIIPAVVARAE